MKSILLIAAVIGFVGFLSFRQLTENNQLVVKKDQKPTAQIRRPELGRYQLTVKGARMEKWRKGTCWLVPTTLTNKSTDSLYYYSMSCSWQDFYTVNNNNIYIESPICQANYDIVLVLAPNQSRTVDIKLFTKQAIITAPLTIKIGLHLIKNRDAVRNQQFLDFSERMKKANIIWSNEILIWK